MAYRTTLNPGEVLHIGNKALTFRAVEEPGRYTFHCDTEGKLETAFTLVAGQTLALETPFVTIHLARIQRNDGTANLYVKAPKTVTLQKEPTE